MTFSWTIFALVLLYFMPTAAAVATNNRNRFDIFGLNLFAGWTFIGWIIALVWAFTKSRNGNRRIGR